LGKAIQNESLLPLKVFLTLLFVRICNSAGLVDRPMKSFPYILNYFRKWMAFFDLGFFELVAFKIVQDNPFSNKTKYHNSEALLPNDCDK
jgi:hypothetical protein